MANNEGVDKAPEQWTIRKLSSEVPGMEKGKEVMELIDFIQKMIGRPPKFGSGRKFSDTFEKCYERIEQIPFKKVFIMMDYVPELSELEKKLDLIVSTIQKDESTTVTKKPELEMCIGFKMNFMVATPDDILYIFEKNACNILIRKKAEPSESIDKRPVFKIKDDFDVRVIFYEVCRLSRKVDRAEREADRKAEREADREAERGAERGAERDVERGAEREADRNDPVPAVHSEPTNKECFPMKRFIASVCRAIKRWLGAQRWTTAGGAEDAKQNKPK